jgi:hypothetical protein
VVVRLLQGQLRPPYEGVEIGVAARLLIRILAEAYAMSETAIGRRRGRITRLVYDFARPDAVHAG